MTLNELLGLDKKTVEKKRNLRCASSPLYTILLSQLLLNSMVVNEATVQFTVSISLQCGVSSVV